MRVLLFGTYDAAAHPRVATIAAGLRAHGLDVAECNAPLGLDTATKVDMLARPWRVVGLLARLLARWTRLARAARRMSTPDVVVVGYLGHFDVHLARLLFPRVPIVLDHLIGAADTARDRGVGGGVRSVLLRAIDAAALGRADLIAVDTEEHRAVLTGRQRARSVVVPVGAPADWFIPPRPRSPGPLRVVFFGLYTPLQGAPVIGAALALLAGEPIEVTMIGTGQDRADTRAVIGADARVRWLDWVTAQRLPAEVASAHVCLGIFGSTAKARRVVPNKVFQGAAAGCAIVTSDTAPQRRTLGEAAVLVPPGDPVALAEALRTLIRDPAELDRLRHAAHELAQERFTPERVAAPLVERLRPSC